MAFQIIPLISAILGMKKDKSAQPYQMQMGGGRGDAGSVAQSVQPQGAGMAGALGSAMGAGAQQQVPQSAFQKGLGGVMNVANALGTLRSLGGNRQQVQPYQMQMQRRR